MSRSYPQKGRTFLWIKGGVIFRREAVGRVDLSGFLWNDKETVMEAENRQEIHGEHWSTILRRFTAVFTLATVSLYTLAGISGIVPEGARVHAFSETEENVQTEELDPAPTHIRISEIGVDAPIENPNVRDVDVLDAALKDGVVHYPGSGQLDEKRNLFFFGHASNLPVVHNSMYKVFTNLPELEGGETIVISSETHDFKYRVTDISLVDAEEERVYFESGSRTLTLSTCNTFGEKSERWVVNAEFVGSSPRAN